MGYIIPLYTHIYIHYTMILTRTEGWGGDFVYYLIESSYHFHS